MSNYNLSTTKSFNIELKDNTLDEYDDLLSRFNNWIENKREIKLNSIFLDKKIEFTVDMNSHILGAIYINTIVDDDCESINLLKRASGSIKSMKFIIKGNNILSLIVEVKTLTTEWGRIIKELLDDDIELELKQHINKKEVYFYFTIPKNIA
jgi:hypothetical protein